MLRYLILVAVVAVLIRRVIAGGWSKDRLRKDLAGAIMVSAFLFLVLKVAGLPV